MILPPFKPPQYEELRAIAEACRNGTENDRSFAERMADLNQLLRQIDIQVRRVDRVYRTPPTPHPNAPGFRDI
jgi:hypothetical protein